MLENRCVRYDPHSLQRFQTINFPIAADIIRMKDGILLEHWDVIQDEATKEQSKSGNPMFGDSFPDRA